jgi:hypothetical protein
MASLTRLTPQKREHFVTQLYEHGNVTLAARSIGLSRQALYQAREGDPEFAAAWEDAVESYADLLEAECDRRAVLGVQRPVLYRGEVVDVDYREYSDSLLMFRLKALRPEKYRERHDHTGKGGGPLVINMVDYANS